jgi:hypothetical protein
MRGGVRRAPLVAQWVVLHQITNAGGAPIDSARTDAAGRFRLSLRAVDSTALYIASTRYDGLAYFSQPIRVSAGRPALADSLYVYDTTSSGPPIAVHRRLVTVAHAKDDGTRDVLEILELENADHRTRISADTTRPVWTGRIPAAAIQFQVGQSDFSADVLARRADSVVLYAPVQPGGPYQLSYAYVLPASTPMLPIPIDQPVAELDLLVEDTLTVVSGPSLRPGGVQHIEGRTFARYQSGALAAGAVVSVQFPRGRFRVQQLVLPLIGVFAVALVTALIIAARRKPEQGVKNTEQ